MEYPLDKTCVMIEPLDPVPCDDCGDDTDGFGESVGQDATKKVMLDLRGNGMEICVGVYCDGCAEEVASRLRESLPGDTVPAARSYTVRELDDLRAACESRWLFGTSVLTEQRGSRHYRAGEKEKAVEEMVRTHMLAGHVAQDLIDEDTAVEPENMSLPRREEEQSKADAQDCCNFHARGGNPMSPCDVREVYGH